MLTFGDLFAGIGGFSLGFERAGLLCKWHVEIDDYATRVLEKHWPDVRRYRDVRECGKHNLEAVDVICGGVPCQPASVAGEQRGTKDDRWLWPETFRIIRELRPTWCVLENVIGLLSLEQGSVFDSLLSNLENMGYEVLPLVIPACAFDASHRRERVFILAYTDRAGLAESRTPKELCSSQGNTPASVERGSSVGGRLGTHWWTVEPDVGRVAARLPHRVDRIRCLGNAVVPQVAEFIGRLIVKAEKNTCKS